MTDDTQAQRLTDAGRPITHGLASAIGGLLADMLDSVEHEHQARILAARTAAETTSAHGRHCQEAEDLIADLRARVSHVEAERNDALAARSVRDDPTLRDHIEAEWFNGNLPDDVRDRLLAEHAPADDPTRQAER